MTFYTVSEVIEIRLNYPGVFFQAGNGALGERTAYCEGGKFFLRLGVCLFVSICGGFLGS